MVRFDGTESSLNQRKYPLPLTIGDPDDNTDYSYHVVTISHENTPLDGLTISDGYAMYEKHSRNTDCFGGGLYIPRFSDVQH